MAEKVKETVIQGLLDFKHLDPYMARFLLEQSGKGAPDIMSKRELVLPPSVLVPDWTEQPFDPNTHEVTGEYVFVVRVAEKKK